MLSGPSIPPVPTRWVTPTTDPASRRHRPGQRTARSRIKEPVPLEAGMSLTPDRRDPGCA
jgi:hypothetical protein